MLPAMSWLIRGLVFVAVGVDVLVREPLGPHARSATAAAYAVCGVLLAVRAGLARRAYAGPLLPWLLGLLTVISAAFAARPDTTTMSAITVMAVIDAGTEVRIVSGWAVFAAGTAAATGGALASGAGVSRTFSVVALAAFGLITGFNRRAYRIHADQSAALLEQAERLRAERHRTAVLDERARLAREIHDVLAHSLGALGIQIQTARALLEGRPDTGRVDGVLAAAQRMASDGLAETRRAVHALRSDRGSLGEEIAEMARTHEQRYATPVAVEVAGTPAPLPPDQTLALVRTAQESLTNAAKHAARRPVAVALSYQDDSVTMSITNPLAPAPEAPAAGPVPPPGPAMPLSTVDGGYGLTGMRERLLLLGGTLDAGCPDGVSWTVTARVPRRPEDGDTAAASAPPGAGAPAGTSDGVPGGASAGAPGRPEPPAATAT